MVAFAIWLARMVGSMGFERLLHDDRGLRGGLLVSLLHRPVTQIKNHPKRLVYATMTPIYLFVQFSLSLSMTFSSRALAFSEKPKISISRIRRWQRTDHGCCSVTLVAAALTKPTSRKKAHQAVTLLSSAALAFGDLVITLTRADPRAATFAHTALRATSCGSDLNVTPRYLDSL
jgi:hypothetical protein